MATAGEIAQAALKRILVQAGDAPLEADEYQDFFEAMNQYMDSLEALNIKLGYTHVDQTSDPMTVPAGAIRGIIANMAIEVSADYNATISPGLANQAKRGMQAMRRLGRVTVESKFPTNLPMGSGTERERDFRFYTLQDLALLSLNGNTRATTIGTTDVAVPVVGFWNVEVSKGLVGDIDGLIQNAGRSEVDLDVNISLKATGNSTYTFTLFKNGAEVITSVASALTSTPTDLTLAKLVTFNVGDFLQIWVEDDLATEDVTVTNAQFRVS